ncbi:MAG: hypothetical protein KGR69_04990 [Verrucomicrobia bacterium]|nr:hypothetical protein [Verrucomicrobiota bacterium]
MFPEIESIRSALRQLDALDDEAMEALATLEAALTEIDRHPASGRVREVVTETADALAEEGPSAEGSLAEKWEELKGQVGDWEAEHPGLVLAIGRVSNSLAAFGL